MRCPTPETLDCSIAELGSTGLSGVKATASSVNILATGEREIIFLFLATHAAKLRITTVSSRKTKQQFQTGEEK
jgi:hypothetical protein